MPWRAAWGTSRGKLCVCAVKGHHTYLHTCTHTLSPISHAQQFTVSFCLLVSPLFLPWATAWHYTSQGVQWGQATSSAIYIFFLKFLSVLVKKLHWTDFFFFKGDAALIISSEMISLNTDKKKKEGKENGDCWRKLIAFTLLSSSHWEAFIKNCYLMAGKLLVKARTASNSSLVFSLMKA